MSTVARIMGLRYRSAERKIPTYFVGQKLRYE